MDDCCCFQSATGISSSGNATNVDFTGITATIDANFQIYLDNSNIVSSNISNLYINDGLLNSNISNLYYNDGLLNSNVSNLLYYNNSNISNIYYNTGYIDSNLLWWRYELLSTQAELAVTKLNVTAISTQQNILSTTVSAQGVTLAYHTGQINALEPKVENLENNTFTKEQTSNIFITSNVFSNVLSNTSNILADYNNLYNRPIIFTQEETSNIFITSNVFSNVLSNTSNTLADYNNLYNKPDVYTKTEIDINNYTKTQTDNTFTTLVQSNLLYLILKNDITNTNNNNKWIVNGSNLYTLDYNIGIGKTNPNYKVDINGSLSSTDYRFNDKQLFSLLPTDSPTFNNGISTQISSNQYYVSYTQNDTMILNKPYTCDILIVGAGGRGGSSYYGGGGGGGEIVYIPNYTLNTGVYNIKIGIDSDSINDRISKLTYQTTLTDLITANGGGNGGLNLFLTSTTTGIIIGVKCSIKYNDESFNDLNPSTYNITFSDGSITLLNIINSTSIVDKSYPNIKDTSQVIINPTAWYKFDDSTNRGLDTMGVANMTNNNAVTTTTGLRGGLQAVFNGTNQYLSTTTFPNINAKSFSFTFWCKCTSSTSVTRTIFGYNAGGSISTRTGFMLYMGAGNQFVIRFGNDDLVYTSPSTYQNRLVFFAITFNITGFVQKLYENGVEVATRTAGGSLNIATPGSMAIGRRNFNSTQEYFGGEIDDFRIYNSRVLSVDEINEIYKGRVNLYNQVNSGGSGGGGGGGNITTSFNQNGAVAGTPFNVTYSKLNAGANGITANGGNGGNALVAGRYTDPISGIQVGAGGTGATASSTPVTKINYGDGGDGNSGLGRQGIIILKFTGDVITKFLEYADYNKLFNKPNLLTQEQTSNIFVTSNLIQNNVDFINYNNLANKPDVYTKTEINTNNYTKTETNYLFYNKTEIDTNIYTKTQSDTNYYTKTQIDTNNYTKTQIDTNIYTKTQIDTNFYTKTQSDTNYYTKALVYTKTESDTNYYPKASVYTKTESDTNYYTKALVYTKTESDNNYYTKTQSDTNYYTKANVYTKTESDNNYYRKSDVYTKTQSDNNYYTKAQIDTSVSTLSLNANEIKLKTYNIVDAFQLKRLGVTRNLVYPYDWYGYNDSLFLVDTYVNVSSDANNVKANDFIQLSTGVYGESKLRLQGDGYTYLNGDTKLTLSSTSNITIAVPMGKSIRLEGGIIFKEGVVTKKLPRYFMTSRTASFGGISCLAYDFDLTKLTGKESIDGNDFRHFRMKFFFANGRLDYQRTPRTFDISMSTYNGVSISCFDGLGYVSSLDKAFNSEYFLYKQTFDMITLCLPTSIFGVLNLKVCYVIEDLLGL